MDFPEICNLKILDGLSGNRYLLSLDDTGFGVTLSSSDDGSGRQRWQIVPVDCDGPQEFFIIIENKDQVKLYLGGDPTVLELLLYGGMTSAAQWQFVPAGDGQSYLLKLVTPTASALLSCSADGTVVDLWQEDDGSGRQRWSVDIPDTGWPASSGSNIELNAATIPAAMKAGFFFTLPASDFQDRLKQGGTIALAGKDLDLSNPDQAKKGQIFLALDLLELHDGARIIIGGNNVVIFVNRLISQIGSIISYPDSQPKAARGADGVDAGQSGQTGATGGAGGSVSIYVTEQFSGVLHVDLRGQDGGDGGNGHVGAVGNQGANGQDANVGYLGDSQSATNGSDGGPGQTGGDGGKGGNGGDGGVLKLVNVGASPIPDTGLIFSATGGQGGIGGQSAVGGPGGPGGDGGQPSRVDNVFRPGGSPGAPGPQGAQGADGVVGTPGSNGQASRNNVDYETVARRAFPYISV